MRKKISSVSGWQQWGRRQSKEEDGEWVSHTYTQRGGCRPHTAQHTRQTSTKLNPPRTTGGQASYEHTASSSTQGLKRGSKQGLNRVDELRDATTSGGVLRVRVLRGDTSVEGEMGCSYLGWGRRRGRRRVRGGGHVPRPIWCSRRRWTRG